MIKVYQLCEKQALARDENHKWYGVIKKSVKVGDIVDEKDCIGLSENQCELIENCLKLIAMCEANPDIFLGREAL